MKFEDQLNQLVMGSRERKHSWDINDTKLPQIERVDDFQQWPDGHCRFVYNGRVEDARRHSSGWAMRNTNNHNVTILKKSCLGVLMCNHSCDGNAGKKMTMRPAICDKARKKQCGKKCPNPNCQGTLALISCRGHCGYPVTHFWRAVDDKIFFQAKGTHDHPAPDAKPSSEYRRGGGRQREAKRLKRAAKHVRGQFDDLDGFPPDMTIPRPPHATCACPPFECVCGCGRNHRQQMQVPEVSLLPNQPPSVVPPFSKLSEDLARRHELIPASGATGNDTPLFGSAPMAAGHMPGYSLFELQMTPGSSGMQSVCPPAISTGSMVAPAPEANFSFTSASPLELTPPAGSAPSQGPHSCSLGLGMSSNALLPVTGSFSSQTPPRPAQLLPQQNEVFPNDLYSSYLLHNPSQELIPEPHYYGGPFGAQDPNPMPHGAQPEWAAAATHSPNLVELKPMKTDPSLTPWSAGQSVSNAMQTTTFNVGATAGPSRGISAFQPYGTPVLNSNEQPALPPISECCPDSKSTICRPLPIPSDNYYRLGYERGVNLNLNVMLS